MVKHRGMRQAEVLLLLKQRERDSIYKFKVEMAERRERGKLMESIDVWARDGYLVNNVQKIRNSFGFLA